MLITSYCCHLASGLLPTKLPRCNIRLPLCPSATCHLTSTAPHTNDTLILETAPPTNEQQFLTASKLLHRQGTSIHMGKYRQKWICVQIPPLNTRSWMPKLESTSGGDLSQFKCRGHLLLNQNKRTAPLESNFHLCLNPSCAGHLLDKIIFWTERLSSPVQNWIHSLKVDLFCFLEEFQFLQKLFSVSLSTSFTHNLYYILPPGFC